MKLLLSLSIIPLLLLTNVSVAEELPLITHNETPAISLRQHNYTYPKVKGFPLLAITAEEDDNADNDDLIVIQSRAHTLCRLFGHKGAGRVLKRDIRSFQGRVYLNGRIVYAQEKWDGWTFFSLGLVPIIHTPAIFKVLRCIG